MPDKVMPGPVQDNSCIREAVCIHTKKIYDSCKEEDIAFYRSIPCQNIIRDFARGQEAAGSSPVTRGMLSIIQGSEAESTPAMQRGCFHLPGSSVRSRYTF